MKRLPVCAFAIALLVGMAANPSYAHQAPEVSKSDLVPIPAYTERYGPAGADSALQAAKAVVESFEVNEKDRILLDIDADIRTSWSNLPAAFVTRGGLKVGGMTPAQRTAIFDLLSASLSEQGYKKVGDILAAEAFLAEDPNAGEFMWAPENYWFAFYGEPSPRDAWGWQFGGHHLAVNMAFDGGEIVSVSPTFLGTEPAVFNLDGVDYEVIVDLHALGARVFETLSAAQKQTAQYPDLPDDVLAGAGNDGVIPERTGLRAKFMTTPQRLVLLNAIRGWVEIQPNENAEVRMTEIDGDLDDTYFAWTGATEVNTPSYFRIQGPDVLIELLSTGGNVGQNAEGKGHYHTIYRKPSLEYGGIE